MDRASSPRFRRWIGFPALVIAGIALALCASAPAAHAAYPAGLSPEEWKRYAPRTPEEFREAVKRARAERPSKPHAASRPAIAELPPPGPEDGRWREWAPPMRSFHAMVVDSRRDRVIVLGGDQKDGEEDMWTLPLDGPGYWEAFGAIGAPSSWSGIAAVYDSTGDRILAIATAYDGSGSGSRSELWQLPLSGPPIWSGIVIAGTDRPTSGGIPGIALDEAGARLFMVRSQDAVWKVNLGGLPTWSRILPAPPVLSYPWYPSIAYASSRDELLVEQAGEIWRLALGGPPQWAPLWPGGFYSPYGRTVYDAATDEVIAVGARGGEAHAISLADGSDRFLTPDEYSNDDRTGFALAFDAKRQRVVLQGGWSQLGWADWSSTRALDALHGTRWSDLENSSGGAHLSRSAFWDEGHDRLVSRGVSLSGYGADLVARSLSDPHAPAIHLHPTGPERSDLWGESATYDPTRNRALYYGGEGPGTLLDELWSLELTGTPAWIKLVPSGTGPGARAFHDAFMDVARDRLVIYGGSTPDPYAPPDAWALEFTPTLTWKALTVAGAEDAVYLRALLFDRSNGDGWAYGGYTGDLWHVTVGDDTLRFDLVPQVGGPTTPIWDLSGVTLDAARHRMLVFEEDYFSRRIWSGYWSVDLGEAAVWTWKSAGGALPYPRYSEASVFDAARQRLVIYAGWDDNDHYFDDWWSLDWERPTPVAASLMTCAFDHGAAHLAWQLADAAGASVTIERSSGGAAWSAIASRLPDGMDRVSFEDADVEPGVRYGWRLRVKAADGERLLGETWLEIPARAEFALRGALRNPVAGDLVVAFSLDRAADATLGLFDLGGRRLAERHVHADAAGPRELTLARRGEYPPGVYFLRLADGTRARSARVVISR